MAWQYAATMEERTGADIKRPPASVIEGLANVSAATAGAELCNTFGIRNSHISGGITAQASNGGKKIVGPAITLQFMPLREDIYPDNINRGPGKLPENPDGARPHPPAFWLPLGATANFVFDLRPEKKFHRT